MKLPNRYPERYIACRDTGHQWEFRSIDANTKGQRVVEIVRNVRCLRCGQERVDRFTTGAVVLGRRYGYDKDYRIPEFGKGDAAKLRSLHLRKQLEGAARRKARRR